MPDEQVRPLAFHPFTALIVIVMLGLLTSLAWFYPPSRRGILEWMAAHIDAELREPVAWAVPDAFGKPLPPPVAQPTKPCAVALTRDGRTYETTIRRVLLTYIGEPAIRTDEVRIRFTLDEPGPPAYYIRAFGGGNDAPPTYWLETDWLPNSATPTGWGDVAGITYGYYDDGGFVNGRIRVATDANGQQAATGWLSATMSGADHAPKFLAGRFAFVLEPIESVDGKYFFSAGQPEDRNPGAWSALEAYAAELGSPRYRVLTFSDALTAEPRDDKVTVLCRFDLDLSMASALQLGNLFHAHGLPATYFVNMASSFYAVVGESGGYIVNPAVTENLLTLRDLGHEIGFHNDQIMLASMFDFPIRSWLEREVVPLRAHGLPMRIETPNGSALSRQIHARNSIVWKENRAGGPLDYGPNGPYTAGRDGVLTYTREGVERRMTLPDLAREDIGIVAAGDAMGAFMPGHPKVTPIVDTTTPLQNLVDVLRSQPLGATLTIKIHPIDSVCNSSSGDFHTYPEWAIYRAKEYGNIDLRAGRIVSAATPASAQVDAEMQAPEDVPATELPEL